MSDDGNNQIFLNHENDGWPDNWEMLIHERIPYFEGNLIDRARRIQTRAIEILKDHRQADGDAVVVNLGVVVRVRADALGPRIYWVKFKGKPRARAGGDTFIPTDPIKMQGRFRYSTRIFAAFPEHTAQQLERCENAFAWVRYRTERLAALRDFCRKTAYGNY